MLCRLGYIAAAPDALGRRVEGVLRGGNNTRLSLFGGS